MDYSKAFMENVGKYIRNLMRGCRDETVKSSPVREGIDKRDQPEY